MQLTDITVLLKDSPIFCMLEEKDMQKLAALAVRRTFSAGEWIFWEDDESSWFYTIAHGRIKVSKAASEGKEVLISFFGPGEMFGEAAVFENKPYPASAQAVTKTCLIGIKKEDIMKFLSSNPQTAISVIGILSGRLRDAQNRLRDMAGERVEQRIARILLMLSSRIGDTLPFTRQEISDMAGTATETAIRVLSDWKDRKIIGPGRGRIVILDELKLRLLAEGPPKI